MHRWADFIFTKPECHQFLREGRLLISFLLFLVLVDLEVAQFKGLLGAGHHAQPVTQVVLLQVLLGQVLQVSVHSTTRQGF